MLKNTLEISFSFLIRNYFGKKALCLLEFNIGQVILGILAKIKDNLTLANCKQRAQNLNARATEGKKLPTCCCEINKTI